MSSHSTLSPSSRYRWSLCPGSVRECAKYPNEPSGPAARDGTASHFLLEYCVKNNLCDPTIVVGQSLTDHEGTFTVDLARALRVKVAVDYIKAQNYTSVKSETRVEPLHLLGRNDMGGTVDVTGYDDTTSTLEIIDFKDGVGEVEAKDNPQLEQYAMGVLAGFKLPINVPYPFDNIKMTIIQPKLVNFNKPAITSYTRSVKEILDMIPQMVSEAHMTDQPDAPLVPGEKQCRFCNARKNCAARTSEALKEVSVMFKPVDESAQTQSIAPVELAFEVATQSPNNMSDEKLREIMEAAPMLRKLLDDVDDELLRRMKDDRKSIPGLKIVNGRGSKAWNLSDDEIAEKLVKMGVPKTEVWVSKLVTPAAAMKLSWQKKDGTVKSLSPRQIELMEKEYITKLAGKLTVVPESDPRKAVVLDVSPLFSAVTPQAAAAPALPSWLVG